MTLPLKMVIVKSHQESTSNRKSNGGLKLRRDHRVAIGKKVGCGSILQSLVMVQLPPRHAMNVVKRTCILKLSAMGGLRAISFAIFYKSMELPNRARWCVRLMGVQKPLPVLLHIHLVHVIRRALPGN